jgi:FkbM family methyltransferase
MYLTIKNIAKRFLPQFIVKKIRRYRYSKAIEQFSRKKNLEIDVMKALIHLHDVVIDLGSNFGWYSKFFSDIVGFQGKVFCIEPVPSSFDILNYTVNKLNLQNVVPIQCAMSDANGMKTMVIPIYNDSFEENHFEAKIVDSNFIPQEHTIVVKTTTLDTFFSNFHKKISFIKCDVEGHQLPCIKGAIGVIKESKPAWLIEVWGDPDEIGTPSYETFRVMNEFGYISFLTDGDRLVYRHQGKRSSNFDYFFLQRNHIQELRRLGLIENDVHDIL